MSLLPRAGQGLGDVFASYFEKFRSSGMMCMESSNWVGRHDSTPWDAEKNLGRLEVADNDVFVPNFPPHLCITSEKLPKCLLPKSKVKI